jgi:lipopolysaccharide export system protein LptC
MNRPANRFSMAMIIAFGAALTLGSFWMLEVMRQATDDNMPAAPRSEPDYYVEKFNFTRLSKTGQAEYNISGKKLIHNPMADTHAIELPVVNNFGDQSAPMTSRAQSAIVDKNNSKVHLYRNVHIDRPATADASSFHLTSEYLLLLPDDDVMQTDKAVEITLGESKLTGTGMYANNATRVLRLASNVHATYPPPTRSRMP